MKYATKLAIAKATAAILILSIVALLANLTSHAYCHGASHNVHGAYCQAVYQSEYTALK